jgi:hypothetical protein
VVTADPLLAREPLRFLLSIKAATVRVCPAVASRGFGPATLAALHVRHALCFMTLDDPDRPRLRGMRCDEEVAQRQFAATEGVKPPETRSR